MNDWKIDVAILKALFLDAVEFRDVGLLSYGVPDYVALAHHPADFWRYEAEYSEIEQVQLEEVGPELYAGMSKQHIVFYSRGKRL